MRKFLAMTLLLACSCAATVWNKPGATGPEFADDQLKCKMDVQMSCGPARGADDWGNGLCRRRSFDDCMGNRGYTKQ
jgi:hypothetical protein